MAKTASDKSDKMANVFVIINFLQKRLIKIAVPTYGNQRKSEKIYSSEDGVEVVVTGIGTMGATFPEGESTTITGPSTSFKASLRARR